MDPNLVRDWDEIRDKEIREREKEKKEEDDKQKKKSKSQSPVKHHKLEKQRQEHKLTPEKNHKDSDKKDKGKRKKKKDVDLDKKKKKKSKEKKEKDDGKKGDDKENKINEGEIKLEIGGANQTNQEPAAPGTSESPPPFESVVVKDEGKIKNAKNVSDSLYGDLDEVAPVDTSWGNFKITEQTETHIKSKEETLGETVEEKPKEPEVLAELPERSKWEVEEDANTNDDKFDSEKQKERSVVNNSECQNDYNQVSVTNEVLKRAENAIFQKTVRTIDVSGKKTVVEKSEGIKDKKLDIIKDKKIESEKHLSKEKKPDNVKEKKSDVSKDKKIEYLKEKKIDTSRDKKVENIKDKKEDTVKDKKPDISKDFKDKKTDLDKDKRPDVKDKKLENVKDRKTDRERRSNDKSSEIKTGPEKSSRRDDYASKHKDKKNLESDAAADSLSIQREARKLGHSIQITIPSDLLDDKKHKDGAKRISAKDRLGEKVEDKDDKHYKSRNEKRKPSRSRSPVRVHSTLIVPEPPSRKVRASPKTRRDSLKKDRNAKTERTTSSNRPSRREDEKKSDQLKKTETRRIIRPDDKHHRTLEHKNISKKEDRLEKKEVKKKEEKREVVKKLKPKETEKKERKNRRLEPDRKVCDETFDNNYEEEIKKLPKDKESDDSVSSSSSSSSSSDSSPVRSKKRKKTKKRKKKHVKKKKLASSSDSDDSDSSSETDDANSSKHKKKKKKEQRKHKVHKKPLKKKKKTKHR